MSCGLYSSAKLYMLIIGIVSDDMDFEF